MCISLAAASVAGFSAEAACLSHNPYDMHCWPSDFAYPVGSVSWFTQNPAQRHAVVMQCAHPGYGMPLPVATCRAAAQAELMAGR